MRFAVAFNWIDFPKYDEIRMEPPGAPTTTRFLYRQQEVGRFQVPANSWVDFPQSLGVYIMEAENGEEAMKKVADMFSRHIVRMTAVLVDEKTEAKPRFLEMLGWCSNSRISNPTPTNSMCHHRPDQHENLGPHLEYKGQTLYGYCKVEGCGCESFAGYLILHQPTTK